MTEPADCLDREAFRLLNDLVRAHQQAPDTPIRIVDAPSGPRCVPAESTTPDPPPSPAPNRAAAVPDSSTSPEPATHRVLAGV